MGEPILTALLTAEEVKVRLNLTSAQAVLRLIREGKIPKVPGLGRLVRVDPNVLTKLYFSGADKLKK